METVLQMIFTLIVIVVVLYLTYILSKWVAVKFSGITKGKYLKVIDSISIGKDKQLVIVELSGKILTLGVTAQNVNILSSLEAEELKEIETTTVNTETDFKSILMQSLKNNIITGGISKKISSITKKGLGTKEDTTVENRKEI